MKKLQNHFTTVEQSKRLLELGVPAWTADCYNTTKHIGIIPDGATYKDVWQMSIYRDENGNHIEMYPCWSLGRLIEIFLTCTGTVSTWCSFLNGSSTIEYILEYRILPALKDGHMDFSKLEEE